MIKGSELAKYVPFCPGCGRILEAYEFCDCKKRLPKDGLRANCPRFIARSGYRGKSYLNCGGKKLRFETRTARDEFYMTYCCDSKGNVCPYINQPMKTETHGLQNGG